MSWLKEVEELERRKQLAAQMGGVERIQRHHDNGRYTVRERISALVDAGSFHEIGALAGNASYDSKGQMEDFVPSNFVLGTADIRGRRVVIGGDDFTVRGGAADAKVGTFNCSNLIKSPIWGVFNCIYIYFTSVSIVRITSRFINRISNRTIASI